MNRKKQQLKLKRIPTARRHIYFFSLLFLGTIVAHNFWKDLQTAPRVAAAEQAFEVVTKARSVNP